MPTKVEFYISTDGVNYQLASTVDNTMDAKDYEIKVRDFKSTIAPMAARFVKVIAKNYGKLPEWHQGYGGDAFIFVDEITIK
jgi:hypothetical protein